MIAEAKAVPSDDLLSSGCVKMSGQKWSQSRQSVLTQQALLFCRADQIQASRP